MPTPVPDRRAVGGADAGGARVRIALNRHRQRELYGSPLGDRVRRLTGSLGITQARLARTLGLSPAMLSQLASARRVKIGDPAVLARLQLLDQRCGTVPPRTREAVEVLLEEVARARLQWTGRDAAPPPVRPPPVRPQPVQPQPVRPQPVRPPQVRPQDVRPEHGSAEAAVVPLHRGPARPGTAGAPVPGPADALRAVAGPARLAAAAATLAPAFPELAAVLRQAAVAPPADGAAPPADDGPRRAPRRPW